MRVELDRRGFIRAGGPLAEVQSVRSPFKNSAAMEIEIAAPFSLHILRVVRTPRARPKPAVPIDHLLGRFGFGGQPGVRRSGRPTVAGASLGMHGGDLSHLAALGQIVGLHEIDAIAALRSGLIDAAEALERIGQCAALRDGHGAGFFAVHILARLGGHDG